MRYTKDGKHTMAYFSTFETRDKLILLYFLQSSGLKLSEMDLLHVALENEWMNYFDFSRIVAELKEGEMITVERRPQGDFLTLAPKGKEILNHFAERLPLSLRHSIDTYAQGHRVQINRASQHVASYYKRGDNDYLVSMEIADQKEPLMSLSISVPTEEMAKTFVNRWEERADDVFAQVLRSLGDA